MAMRLRAFAGGVIVLGVTLLAAHRQPSGRSGGEGSVSAWGAVGDGRSDDTAAIQAAVDGGSGRIWFGPGTYRLTRTVLIDLDKVGPTSLAGDGTARILVACPGPAFRFLGTHQGTADPDSVQANVWQRQRMPTVDGLEIVGDHPEACGLQATGTMQLTLTRLTIRKVLHGIHLVGRNRNLIVSDCHIYENRGVGIYYDHVSLHQSNITGCHISYNGQGGIVSRGGDVRNIQVTGCDLEANMSPDAPPTANILIDCTGSNDGTGEVAITGCTIQHASRPARSANIRILGRSNPAKDQPVVREGHVTITGNVLSDVKVNVHLKDCRGVVITGNTFWMGYEHNLLIEDCSNIVVGPNNFDRNPRYDYGNARETINSLVVRGSQDCTLSGLHVAGVWRDPAGVRLENCRRMNITGCTILDCDHVGLLLQGVSDSHIGGCLIRDDRPSRKPALALKIVGGRGNWVSHNLLVGGCEIAPGSAREPPNGDVR